MALYYDAHLDWFHRWLGGGAAPSDPKEVVDGAAWPTRPPAEH